MAESGGGYAPVVRLCYKAQVAAPGQSTLKTIMLWAAFILALAPALIQPAIIHCSAVEFPCPDQWYPDIAGMFIRVHQHQLTFGDLAAPHNEHRFLCPRIAFLLLGWLTNWSITAELYCTWVFTLVASGCILWLIRQTRPQPSTSLFEPAVLFNWFIANLLVFHPLQLENWFWGIGLANVMPVTFFLCGLVAASSSMRDAWRIALAIFFSAAATYSSGNGILAWPLVGIVLGWSGSWAELRQKRASLLCYGGACIACIAIYFFRYHPTDQSSAASYFAGVIPSLRYFLVFCGSILSYGTTYSQLFAAEILGGAMLAILIMTVAALWSAVREHEDPRLARSMLIWLSIAGFAVISGMLAALTRSGFGVQQATTSRYITFSLYLPLALAQLVPMALGATRVRAIPGFQSIVLRLPPALLAGMLTMLLFGVHSIRDTCELERLNRRQAKAAALMAKVFPENPMIAAYASPEPVRVLSQVQALSDLGYLRPGLIESRDVGQILTGESAASQKLAGQLEQVQVAGENVEASGFAIFIDAQTAADAVLLTCKDERGNHIIAAQGRMAVLREDVQQKFGAHGYRLGGWIAKIPISALPPNVNAIELRAWTLNVDTGRATLLAGSYTINR